MECSAGSEPVCRGMGADTDLSPVLAASASDEESALSLRRIAESGIAVVDALMPTFAVALSTSSSSGSPVSLDASAQIPPRCP
jgi:hypothetical protein